VARALALIVAAAFGLAPLAIWLSFLDENRITWSQGVLALEYELGAALLAVGARRWYGSEARLLRVGGFLLLLAGALATVSYAWLLIPTLLLAAPSLRNRGHAAGPASIASP